LRVDSDQLTSLHWSIPRWNELATDPNNKGVVRHGGLLSPIDYTMSGEIEAKLAYGSHAQVVLDLLGDTKGEHPRALLAWGTRNTFQNLGLPGWHSDFRNRLLRRPDEPWEDWSYHALCKYSNRRMGIELLQFRPSGRDGAPDAVVISGHREARSDLEWVVTGQPLLWDGEIPPIALLAACTYDLRHVWHLLWEKWQWESEPCQANHSRIHESLINAFMEHLRRPLEERAAVLAFIAAREGLALSDGYLHSSLGLSRDGSSMFLIARHGSLTDLGRAHQELGSYRAILLDNGGSVGYAYWAKRRWEKEGWQAIRENPVYLGNGSYFRPHGHAVLVAELAEDILERPFISRPSASAPWFFDNR
jgi:hypothetical protein